MFKLPLSYIWRNLLVRRGASLMSILGIAAAATVFLAVAGLRLGMEQVNARTGTERHLLVLRKGPPAEAASSITLTDVERLRALPGVARTEAGEPLVSAEIVTAMNLPRSGGRGKSNVTFRGVQDMGSALRDGFRIVEGRMFRPGLNEVIVARAIADRFQGLRLGDAVQAGSIELQVVGLFEAGESAYDSEVWADFSVIQQVFRRGDPSSVLLLAESEAVAEDLQDEITGDTELALKARTLPSYFDRVSQSTEIVLGFTQFLAVVLGIGAVFAAANTMYAAVAQRGPEIGILRAIGFKRGTVRLAFLLESAVLGLLGGVLGDAAALGLAASGLRTGTTNWVTFSEQTFHVQMTPNLMLGGLVFGLVVGGIGGFLPALRASRGTLMDSLQSL